MKKHLIKFFVLTLLIVGASSFQSVGMKFLPTSLKVTVLDELGNRAEGIEVTLYASKEDYKAETNPLQTKVTDDDGEVVFKKLDPQAYYIHATLGEKNNIGSGVLTQELEEGRVNKVNTIID